MKKIIHSKKAHLCNLIFVFVFCFETSFATEHAKEIKLELPSQFDILTSKNFKHYTKPVFTTIGQGFNSNLYTTALYPETFSIGIDLSSSGVLIPSSQQSYIADIPSEYGNENRVDNALVDGKNISENVSNKIEQPTYYGGDSKVIYAVSPIKNGFPGDSIYKSLSFLDGSDINTMLSVPAIQLSFGLPTRTQLRVRYLTAGVDDVSLNYFGINLNQQFDRWLDYLTLVKRYIHVDKSIGLAFNASYNQFSVDEFISFSTWSLGLHASKTWESDFSVYTGFQLEDLSGEFNIPRASGDEKQKEHVSNSPFEEVRNLEPLKFDIESFTSWRYLIGGSYKTGIVEFHLDFGYASQPFLNGGISISFKEWDNKETPKEDNLENN